MCCVVLDAVFVVCVISLGYLMCFVGGMPRGVSGGVFSFFFVLPPPASLFPSLLHACTLTYSLFPYYPVVVL